MGGWERGLVGCVGGRGASAFRHRLPVQCLVVMWLAELTLFAALPALCAAWKPEGEWIAKLDLVESGDQLLVKEMAVVRELGLLSWLLRLPAAAAAAATQGVAAWGKLAARGAEVPLQASTPWQGAYLQQPCCPSGASRLPMSLHAGGQLRRRVQDC